jgi:hypothetical protein
MGTERHGRRRARWLVPAVAVAGAVAAAGARAARARRAAPAGNRAGEGADTTAAAGAVHPDRPHLPTREPVRPGAATPAPPPDDIDLDVAARALTALSGSATAASNAPASSAPAARAPDPVASTTSTSGGDTLTATPEDGTALPPANGASRPATPPPGPRDAGTPTNGARSGGTTAIDADRAGPTPDPPAPMPAPASTSPPPPAAGRATRLHADRRRHRLRMVAGVVVIGMGIGAAAAVAGVGDADDSASTDPTTTTTTTAPSTTTTVAITAESIFPAAAQRLTEAGTFRYTGDVSADDVSHVRPMLWFAVSTTVAGEVSVGSAAMHEVATATDGRVSETVAIGQQVWGRLAAEVDALPEVPFATVPELSAIDGTPPVRGAVLLPALLLGATAPAEQGVDDAGRRAFAATLPAELLGPVERGIEPVDARLVLSVDDTGAPAHVEIDTETVGGPRFHVVLELADLGAPVSITPPA